VITSAEVRATAAHIAEWQHESGLIPWFPGGHSDPWNHVEAAMALAIGGFRSEAEQAYQWLADHQRDDGSWHQYYVGEAVENDQLDANTIAYVATGVRHHFACHLDRGFLETMWPVIDASIEFVLALQQPRGEVLWARHLDGTAWPFALLTGSSSIAHSLRSALAIAEEIGVERPHWVDARTRLVNAITRHPDTAFASKKRWAMDWYYPVLSGSISGTDGRAHLDARFETFALDDKGIRCVNDRPWVTTAETCECAMAYASVGDVDRARQLFGAAQAFRQPDGRYRTGVVFPEEVTFPRDECSTYSAAAVVLAADVLRGSGPTAAIFAPQVAKRAGG